MNTEILDHTKKVRRTFMRRFDPAPRVQSFNNLKENSLRASLSLQGLFGAGEHLRSARLVETDVHSEVCA